MLFTAVVCGGTTLPLSALSVTIVAVGSVPGFALLGIGSVRFLLIFFTAEGPFILGVRLLATAVVTF